MTTEAGRRLLALGEYHAWDCFGGDPCNCGLDGHIAAIEAEDRAALLAELEAGVKGLLRHRCEPCEPDPDGWMLARVAVLDIIRKEGKK